jgi:hypothetical protein
VVANNLKSLEVSEYILIGKIRRVVANNLKSLEVSKYILRVVANNLKSLEVSEYILSGKIRELEEELRVVANNLKSLGVSISIHRLGWLRTFSIPSRSVKCPQGGCQQPQFPRGQ